MIAMNNVLLLAISLFLIGLSGVVLRRNILIMFMSIELMLNGVNLSFVTFARYLGKIDGQVAAFFVIVLAAAEAAVGLAIIILLFRRQGSVQSNSFQKLNDRINDISIAHEGEGQA